LGTFPVQNSFNPRFSEPENRPVRRVRFGVRQRTASRFTSPRSLASHPATPLSAFLGQPQALWRLGCIKHFHPGNGLGAETGPGSDATGPSRHLLSVGRPGVKASLRCDARFRASRGRVSWEGVHTTRL
jgi:hypothetical protein